MSFFTKKTADVAVIDCFDASVSCKEIRLSNSNTIAQGKRDGVCVAYLSKLVTPIGVYRWTFRLRKVGSPPSLYIGVWKTKHGRHPYSSVNTKGKCYSYAPLFASLNAGDKGFHDTAQDTYGDKRCKEGDIIEMVLDLKKFQLRYIVNGKDYGVAFKVERTTYRAAVSMKQRTAVEIVIPGAKLGSMNKMNDDDAKCNKCDRFKTQITKLKKAHALALSDNQSIIAAMQKRVSQLESQNKKEMQTIRELSANNKEKQDHIERLKAESRAIKAEILSYKTNVQRGNDSESIITAMQQRIMSLEAKNKKATEIIQELRTSSDSVNERQRKNSKNKQDELTNLEREKKEALERVDRLETENIQLSEANTRMHASNKSLQKQYDDSSTECKELQMELKTVTAKYDALCRKANID
eukprot:955819_1